MSKFKRNSRCKRDATGSSQVSSLESGVGRVQASLILAQVCRAVSFVWPERSVHISN